MSARATYALMVAFLVLGSFAFFDPFSLRAKREEGREKEQRIFWLKGERLESIRLVSPESSVALRCVLAEGCAFDGTGDWALESPLKEPADPSNVGSLAGALLNLNSVDRLDLDQPADPKEFGFAGTQVEILLKGATAPKILAIGAAQPMGGGVYAQDPAEPKRVYVVATYLPSLVKKELFHWRDKRLFRGVAAETISRLDWSGLEGAVAGERQPAGGWQMKAPVAAAANPIVWEGLAGILASASARRVQAEQGSDLAKKLGSAKPTLDATFLAAGQSHRLRLYPLPGDRDVKEFAAVVGASSVVYAVDSAPFLRFLRKPFEYRQRKLFPGRDPASVTELNLKFPRHGKTVTLQLKGDVWAYASGDKPEEALSEERLRRFVAAALTLEAEDFAPAQSPAARELKKPADIEVTFLGSALPENKARFVVHERRWAVTDSPRGGGEVMRFGEELLKYLPVRPQDLYQSANQQVVTQPQEPAHGHDHSDHSDHAH